jgi:hypothetical protein
MTPIRPAWPLCSSPDKGGIIFLTSLSTRLDIMMGSWCSSAIDVYDSESRMTHANRLDMRLHGYDINIIRKILHKPQTILGTVR